MLSKKNYIVLANAFGAARAGEHFNEDKVTDSLLWTVISILEADNPRFDKETFIKAIDKAFAVALKEDIELYGKPEER